MYCIWQVPSTTAIKSMCALSDCSILLYIMTERWPSIRRYHDTFEAIKRRVLDLMAEDKRPSRKILPETMGDIWPSLQNLDFDVSGDIEQMFGNVTSEGNTFPPWNIDNNTNLFVPLNHESGNPDAPTWQI